MSSNGPAGVKRSAEEVSFHDNETGRDHHQQPFPNNATLPMNLIMGSILPFVQDRSTWNNLCFANKELRGAGRTMTPPWPETTLQQACFARAMAFSPCGHYLAGGTVRGAGSPSFVHIFDRRNGQHTSLRGQIEDIFCLVFSGDGKYLASGGTDRFIEIWPTNSTRKPTQLSSRTLPGQHQTEKVQCLAFASDSNILASGSRDEIKLWNVEDGVCIHSFHHRRGNTSSLVFAGVGESIRCLAATTEGTLIRISRKSSHHEFTSEIIVLGTVRFLNTAFSTCGSFVAKVDLANKLCLYVIEAEGATMMRSVNLPTYSTLRTNAGLAFSPDNKMLAVISETSGGDDTVVRLLEVKDLTLRRHIKLHSSRGFPVALAVDPSSRYLATACYDGSVRLYELNRSSSSFASSPAAASASAGNPVSFGFWSRPRPTSYFRGRKMVVR
jgi:WD40 repeat protein